MKNKADADKAYGNVGGRSTVFVMIPTNSPTEQDNSFVTERMSLYKTQLAGK